MTDEICRNIPNEHPFKIPTPYKYNNNLHNPPKNKITNISYPPYPQFKFNPTHLLYINNWDTYSNQYELLINGYNYNNPNKKITKDGTQTYRKIKSTQPIYIKLYHTLKEFIYLNDNIKNNGWTLQTIREYIDNVYIPTMKSYDDKYLECDEKNIKLQTEWDNTTKIIQSKIDELTDWNDFIVYDGVKYGIKPYINGIHTENNCNGTKIFCVTIFHLGNLRPFMTEDDPDDEDIYICNKCKCEWGCVRSSPYVIDYRFVYKNPITNEPIMDKRPSKV